MRGRRKANGFGCFDQCVLFVDGEVPACLQVVETDDDEPECGKREPTVHQRRRVRSSKKPEREQHAANSEVQDARNPAFAVVWKEVRANKVGSVEIVGEFIDVLAVFNGWIDIFSSHTEMIRLCAPSDTALR